MDVHIISYDNFPGEQVAEGSRIEVSLVFAETRKPMDVYCLSFELIKHLEGWKIKSCELAE